MLTLMKRLLYTTCPFKTSSTICRSLSTSTTIFQDVNLFRTLIQPNEYRNRHRRLAETVHQLNSSTSKLKLLLIPASERTFQADTIIPSLHFKQNGDFTYMTGLNTSDAAGCVFALLVDNGSIDSTFLFAPVLVPRVALWEGHGIRSAYHQQKIIDLNAQIVDFAYMHRLLENNEIEVFLSKYWSSRPDLVQRNLGNKRQVMCLTSFLDRMRAFKSEAEMEAMRRTCAIGLHAMNATVNWSAKQFDQFETSILESQLANQFDYECRVKGATKMAYPQVVAGQDRATVIHYGANCNLLAGQDWLLMDAGCEDVDGYVSDITRCWRVDGQRSASSLHYALHQALCETQQSLIKSIRVGHTSLNMLLNEMCNRLGILLKEFGLISPTLDSFRTREAVFTFCPHHVSHYLGLDVHDSGSFSRDEPLNVGMCFTIEPGLYFRRDHHADIPDEFKGIGLRIEDDLLINARGEVENLTQQCSYFL